jgi:hypothetical protein
MTHVGGVSHGANGNNAAVRRIFVVSLLILVLSACNGGTVDLHALKQDSEAIDSLACEGALLANEIANAASTAPFSRVHAGELAVRAQRPFP